MKLSICCAVFYLKCFTSLLVAHKEDCKSLIGLMSINRELHTIVCSCSVCGDIGRSVVIERETIAKCIIVMQFEITE